jgi:hypothetical protein
MKHRPVSAAPARLLPPFSLFALAELMPAPSALQLVKLRR